MSIAYALLTSDPNLVQCEMERLAADVSLTPPRMARPNVAGVGSYAGDDVLLQRLPPEHAIDMAALAPRQESEALVFHAGFLPLGMSHDENVQPFRYRRWLFTHVGQVNAFPEVRARLRGSLPEYLQRQIRGETDSEAAFMLFLRLLRDLGRTDDSRLEAATVAHLLAKTAKMLEQFSADAGATRTSVLNFVATNGYVLAAYRHGEQPLHYTLLEGRDRCQRCGLDGRSARTEPLLKAHLRSRTVAIATDLAKPAQSWIELKSGHALAVGTDLSVRELASP